MNYCHLPFIRKVSILVFLLFYFNINLRAQQSPLDFNKNKEVNFPKASQFKDAKLTYQIIKVHNNTYAYDIYTDNKLMIHQNSIPALPGKEGFKLKAYAEKAAQLVIQKIMNGEMPPTLSIEEMKKLNIINR